jgi:hypothetical protein
LESVQRILAKHYVHRNQAALVDIMKNYMANRSFSRGIDQVSAEASMVFMGNTKKSVAYMLKHSHFFDQLPDKYIDSAFLDRLHAYSPGWEVSPVRSELFTSGYGFIVGYVRMFFQVRNFMEFLQMIHEIVDEGDEVRVHLVTQSDPDTCVKQEENLNQLVDSFTGSKVAFSWELDHNTNFHARNITTDTGWKITLDRGLDMFQKYEPGPFSLSQAMQEARLTRGVEVTYLRV